MAHALEGFRGEGREFADSGLGAGRRLAHPLAEPADGPPREREDEEHDEGEFGVLIEHQRDQQDDHQQVLDEAGHGGRGGLADECGIAGQIADQAPGGSALEPGEVEPQQVVEQLRLEIGDDPQPDPVHQHRLAEIGEAADRHCREDGEGHDSERGAVAGDENVADHRFHEPGESGLGAGGDDHAENRPGQLPAIGREIAAGEATHEVRRRALRRRRGGRGDGGQDAARRATRRGRSVGPAATRPGLFARSRL